MSVIHLDNRLAHYEVFGRGQPIIFLHSWMGSWRYWVPIMDIASERHRAYAFDFWGFGESDRRGEQFTVAAYAEMLLQFMNRLGIARATLVGHGMGGMVAILAAHQYPDRFSRLLTVCTPLHGQVLAQHIKPGALSRLLGMNTTQNGWARMVRSLQVADAEIQHEIEEDTASLSEKVLNQVHESLLETDLRPHIISLQTPLLAVYGGKDPIVNPAHAAFLNELAERPIQLLVLPKASHFPFLEQANTFGRLLLDFLV
ncbi:alpha/beta hydrolase, partial [Chloroflexus sp.]|uniref:alpha/beta fold hydrolase n=1 Tax=Chloroflexus sp. TaxID=1904827 RepID=UPI00298ED5CC